MGDVQLRGGIRFPTLGHFDRISVHRRIPFPRRFHHRRVHQTIPSSTKPLNEQSIQLSEDSSDSKSITIANLLQQHDEALLETDLDQCWSLLCRYTPFSHFPTSEIEGCVNSSNIIQSVVMLIGC